LRPGFDDQRAAGRDMRAPGSLRSLKKTKSDRSHHGFGGAEAGLRSGKADDGTRTHDLLHGKQTL
jgi:hypothetical protein